MQKTKKLRISASVITIITSLFLCTNFGKSFAATLEDVAIAEDKVKYVNVSMADINPEPYNAQMRGMGADVYYPKDIVTRANIDSKALLFGTTEGMNVGGLQNDYIGPNDKRECDGVVQGLVENTLKNGNIVVKSTYSNGTTLFPTTNETTGWDKPYNEILLNWQFPFLKGENGYYSFNSDQYHVTRDYQNKKFVLHKGARAGFYPFNSCNDDTTVMKNRDLYFTAKFEIPFLMNSNGKIKNSTTGQYEDMVFNFSGDDDVWIFVDDQLVVDLGGLHIKQTGDINFSKNQVHYSSVYDENNNKDISNYYTEAIKGGRLKEGEHTLKVFYMERAGGESNLFVSFNLQSSGVKVNHIEKYTNKILGTKFLTGPVDEIVETSAEEFANHRLVEKPQNEKIKLNNELQTVNYYYDIPYELNVNYVDINNNQKIADSDTLKYYEGDEYKTTPKEIKDYELVKDSGNTSGKMGHENKTVTYYYVYNNAKAKANYIDKITGEKLGEESKVGKEGEKISFEEKDFENYILVEKPKTNDVTFTKKDQEINYYYKMNGKININYIEKENGEKLATEEKKGIEGDKVTTEEKQFDNYALYQAPKTNEYTIERNEQVVNYYYVHQSQITVNYIDKDTNERLDQINDLVKEGITYKTEEKEFENYKIIEKPETNEVTIGKEDITINYYYQKLKFNLKIEMNMLKATVNSHFYELNGKVDKVETEIREANGSSKVKIYYNVKITNDQERTGSGTVSVEVPTDYIVNGEDNLNWNVNSDGQATLKVVDLEPNESREYELVLTKNTNNDISKIVKNTVKIKSDSLEEVTLEDNQDTNELVIMPRTGIKKTITFVIAGLGILVFIVYLVIRKAK